MPSGDVYVLDFHEEVLRGCVDKMAFQSTPFPGAAWPLATGSQTLSIVVRFKRMS